MDSRLGVVQAVFCKTIKMTQRINYIDRMKGLAILIVVFVHVYVYILGIHNQWGDRICASIETPSLQIPLFMFISGFVAYLPSETGVAIHQRLKRRFLSYIFPAFSVYYALALYNYVVLGYRDIDVVSTLIGGLWYLKALAIFVCLQAIIVKIKRIYWALAFIVMMECLFFVGWKASPFLHSLFCLEHCFFSYPFFMLGYYFRCYKLMEYLQGKIGLFTICLVDYLTWNNEYDFHLLRFLSERIVHPLCVILVITWIFARRKDEENRLERWLNGMGTKTLDIYIYHEFLIRGSFSWFDLSMLKQNEAMQANPMSYLLLALVISLFLMYLSIYIGALIRKSHILSKIVYGK